jgi:hypothetical protein
MKNSRRPGTQGCGIEKSADSTRTDFALAVGAAAGPAGVTVAAGRGRGASPVGLGTKALAGAITGDEGGGGNPAML